MKLDSDIQHYDDITRSSYDEMAKHWHNSHSELFFAEDFPNFSQNLPSGKIIDIGCGTAKDTHFFLEHGYDYLGIDNSKGMIEIARKTEPKAQFEVRSFYDLDYADASFDGFWADTSLLHVPKRKIKAVLGAIRRIVRPGGVGFICMKPLGEKGEIEDGFVTENRYGGLFKRYFALYSMDEFAQVLDDCDFHVLKKYVKHKENKIWLVFLVKNSQYSLRSLVARKNSQQ